MVIYSTTFYSKTKAFKDICRHPVKYGYVVEYLTGFN